MFPICPGALDVFIILNIMGTLMILIVSVFISHPMELYSFPTLLLITTLFRLSLNVSSTRLILSYAEAGKIIEAFGQIMTNGHVLVGVVIFLVLMIIQFIVVTKGSERVAEVAARFTLDALPGKQMSIDADLRAGMIHAQEAAMRRMHLIKESKFYGSMDGAMKFVKGDVIAGFCITFINILGGLSLGVFERGMDIAVAAKHYTLLTIGDGLVSQIPALLVSLSAGFIVTRVTAEDNGKPLGGEIGIQFFLQPIALLVVAGLCLIIGVIPGFPSRIFFFFSSGLGVFSLFLILNSRLQKKELKYSDQNHLDPNSKSSFTGFPVPLLLELSPKLFHKISQGEKWPYCLNEIYPKLKTHISHQIGVPIPDLKIAMGHNMESEKYAIQIYEIPVEIGEIQPDDMLDQKKKSPEEILLRNLAKAIIKNVGEFVGIQEVRDILTGLEKHYPDLVREVVPRLITLNKLTDVVKRLVDEQIPVTDFRLILEILSGIQPEDKNCVDLTELIRMGLKRIITYKYASFNSHLSCFGLDPEIEAEIEAQIQKTGSDCYLHLSPQRIQQISSVIGVAYKIHTANEKDVVILTHSGIRRYVKKIIETDLPDVAVLSYQELDASVRINLKDTISLSLLECS